MIFKSLENIPTSVITEVFNSSFSDYAVPMQLTEKQLLNKMKNDRIDLSISGGAFENDNLVGFVLHGRDTAYGIPSAYNGGTGVIPSKRGNKITQRLYEYLVPLLKDRGIEQCLLEVIDTNEVAIRSYQSIGFKTSRELICFQGQINTSIESSKNQVHKIELPELNIIKDFWNYAPTWQNSYAAISQSRKHLTFIGIKNQNKLLAYAAFEPKSGKIRQFGTDVDFRRKGLASRIFNEIKAQTQKEIKIINIDARDHDTISFLENIGLEAYVNQLEMRMEL